MEPNSTPAQSLCSVISAQQSRAKEVFLPPGVQRQEQGWICRYADSRRKHEDSLCEQKQEGHAQLRAWSDLTPDVTEGTGVVVRPAWEG